MKLQLIKKEDGDCYLREVNPFYYTEQEESELESHGHTDAQFILDTKKGYEFEQHAISNAIPIINPVPCKIDYDESEVKLIKCIRKPSGNIVYYGYKPLYGINNFGWKEIDAYEYIPLVPEPTIVAENAHAETTTAKEYILCAAIHYDDGEDYPHQPKNIQLGFVMVGRRHHNCIINLSITMGDKYNKNLASRSAQGFITNLDRYVNRKEAFRIALSANQIIHNFYDSRNVDQILFSEDLY